MKVMGNVPELHEYIAASFLKTGKGGELELQIKNEPRINGISIQYLLLGTLIQSGKTKKKL